MNEWIDVTQTLQKSMAYWPGQEKPEFSLLADIKKGDMANVTKIDISCHTGTHMDAPLHFLDEAQDISTMPVSAMVGAGKIMLIEEKEHISKKAIQQAEERVGHIKKGDRILFKTHHSNKDWIMEEFRTDYTALAADGAQYLVDKGIALVGIDYLSIAPYDNLVEIHQILLKQKIWIVEGLRLLNIEEGEYEIICLPLKIKGADGAPARVLVRRNK